MLGLLTFETGAAATLEARWEMYERANAGGFEPGETPVEAPGAGTGYEIVSFAAAGLGEAFGSYMYGGLDLPAEHGGPMAPVVGCSSSFTASEMFLEVSGAYPFAGCVFFLGISNTGDEPIRVHLGALDGDAEVTCDTAGCEASDIEMVAGSPDAGDALTGCELDGEVGPGEGDVLALAAGSTLVCPVFVIVLQPANEATRYTVVIEPPELETPGPEILTFEPEPQPPGLTNQPPDDVIEHPDTDEEPEPPSPTDVVEGERTPGPEPTPIPPDTGTALVQRYAESQTSQLATVLFGLAAGVLVVGFGASAATNGEANVARTVRAGSLALLVVVAAATATGLAMALLRMA